MKKQKDLTLQALEIEYRSDARLMHLIFSGPPYRDVLGWFHKYGKPRNYLEIGVADGGSFRLAGQETLAIGVDPNPVVPRDISDQIFRETSDSFFARDAKGTIFGEPVQFAFIDGLHTFDQALRDFINVEKIAGPESVIVFHDVRPIRPKVALRQRQTIFWTGDVWKTAAILASERKDLSFLYVPTAPSGLLIVTRLSPKSTKLLDNFAEIKTEWIHRELPENLEDVVSRFERMENFEGAIRAFVKTAWGPRPATERR